MTILLLVLFICLVLICLEQPRRRRRRSPLYWSSPRAGLDSPGPHGSSVPARDGDLEDVT